MEHIFIEDGKDRIVLSLENNKLSGFKFHPDNSYEAVDDSVFGYFNFLKLSNNRQSLPNEGEYLVVLDKDTNYKHYFLNGKEDLEMFFFNNGEDATMYSGDGVEPVSKCRKFIYGLTKIVCGIAAVTMIFSSSVVQKRIKDNADITLEEMHDIIYAASDLTLEEKEYVYNEDMFEYILPYVNKSSNIKYLYRNSRYGCLDINYYEKSEYPNLGGFLIQNKNAIYVSESQPFCLAHEVCHELQYPGHEYLVLVEGLTDIFANEFYGYPYYGYANYVVLTKKMIETLGIDAIMTYNITNQDGLIRERISQYLTEEQCDRFFACLKTEPIPAEGNYDESKRRNKELEDELSGLIDIVANKMGITFDEYEMLHGMKKYFNQNEVRPQYVSYIKELQKEAEIKAKLRSGGDGMPLKEALDEGLIKLIKVDEHGNMLGEATYDDMLHGSEAYHIEAIPNSEKYDYISLCIINRDGNPVLYSSRLLTGPYITYDNFEFEDEREYEDVYGDFFSEKELPKYNYKEPYEYPDGSTVRILDDDTVIKKEKDGSERFYKLDSRAKLVVGNKGLIYWLTKSGVIYRIIFPDGMLLEKIANDRGSNCQYVTSTGEILNMRNSDVNSYTTYDGQFRMIVNNGQHACVDWLDKDGKKIGTKDYCYQGCTWLDNDGNVVMDSQFDCAEYFNFYTVDQKTDAFGNSVKIYKSLDGIVYYYPEHMSGFSEIDYPNGYKVYRTVESNDSSSHDKLMFYNDKGELIATKYTVGCEVWGPDILTLIDYNHNIDIYYGKYQVKEDDDGINHVSLIGSELENDIPDLPRNIK